MEEEKTMIIAVDFDGTLCTDAWAAVCADGAAGKYGAITIATVDGNCVATLDPESKEDVNIPNDIAIDQFVYDRDFKIGDSYDSGSAAGAPFATVCLPFSGIYGGGSFYKIASIKKEDKWRIYANGQSNTNSEFEAGVPYFVQTSWSGTENEWCMCRRYRSIYRSDGDPFRN